MSLFYKDAINPATKIGVWRIAEPEKFFLQKVPVSNTITHLHKRLQHLAGRYLLQTLFPDFPYHFIELADTRKPYLPDEQYHFSISHCGGYSAAIVSTEKRVGVDIEMITQRVLKIRHKFLNDQELALHPAADEKALTLFWSVKETVYKWYGNGNVDFRKHINITQPNISLEAGAVTCQFIKEQPVELIVEYQFFNDICLAWVAQ